MRPLPAIAVALLIATAPLAQAGAAGYVAQTTWGVKGLVALDKAWLFGRPLWNEKVEGRDVRVAILDTGIDATHPDLQGTVAAFRDFAGDRQGRFHTDPYDDVGHGTHIAGIIAGRGHFQGNPLKQYWITGEVGLAPAAKLIVARVASQHLLPDDATLADAFRWAADPDGDGDPRDGAHVVVFSLGREVPGDPAELPSRVVGAATEATIHEITKRGAIVVAPSGNGARGLVQAPCHLDVVVCVGATDREGYMAHYSSYGRSVDVVAPSVVVSAWPEALGGGYQSLAGTSVAAAVVGGLVALMVEANPKLAEMSAQPDRGWKSTRLTEVLKATATKVPNVENTEGGRAGAGLVHGYGALAAVDAGGGGLLWWVIALLGAVVAGAAWFSVRPTLRRRAARKARKDDDED
ncbi:MAG TPA: S8 family serine peptidase [Candidatus Thermoplasmatota archaeon]|nr:S8 family serine peptidase [Candidatus Thermoplasmatota archaeon]